MCAFSDDARDPQGITPEEHVSSSKSEIRSPQDEPRRTERDDSILPTEFLTSVMVRGSEAEPTRRHVPNLVFSPERETIEQIAI